MKKIQQRLAQCMSTLLVGALLVPGATFLPAHSHAAAADNGITIDKSSTRQEIWGFGGAANDVVDELYSNPAYDDVRDEIMDRLFKTTGDLSTGLSVIRWEINPFLKTETGPQRQSFYYKQATVHPDADTWDWDTDYHQKWFGDEANKRASDMQYIAVPWSPPTWMKDQATNSLKPENYDEFANYIATWLEKYKTGVPFSANDPTLHQYNFKWVSVQNEPELNTNYGSSHYDAAELGKVAVKVKNAVMAKGLDVKVGAPETGSRSVAADYLKSMSPEALAAMDFIPVHDYGPAVDLSAYNKPVWTTEYCYLTSNNPEISDGLNLAQSIYDRLTISNDPGWLQWWFVAPNSTNGEPLIHLKDGGYTTNKRLYTMGQFSRFMRPGDIRIDAVSSNPNLQVVATKNAQNKASLVVINNWPEDYSASIKGMENGTASVYRTSDTEDIASLGYQTITNGMLNYTFPAKSVTTIVEGTADAPSSVKADPMMAKFSTEVDKDPNKYYPVSDTFARNGIYADTLNGTLSTIDVKSQPGFDNPDFTRRGFLQFDLSDITEPIESVTFNINGLTDSGLSAPGLALFGINNNDWNEYSLTWNNMPDVSGAPIGYFTNIDGTKKKFTFDVTDWVKNSMTQDKKVSFAITDTLGADQMARFDSKDNDWSLRPTLMVTPSLWPADSSLTASGITENSVKLNWTPASSPDDIVAYSLYMNGNLVQTFDAQTFSYTIGDLAAGASYTFQVKAETGTGRWTSDGPTLSLKSGDSTPPTWTEGSALAASGLSPTGVTLAWPMAKDDGGISHYVILQNGVPIKTVASTVTALDIAGLNPGTLYAFAVKAEDGNGNASARLELPVTTLTGGDTTIPYWEAGGTFLVSDLTTGSATVSWTEAKDNMGVKGYRLYSNGTYLSSSQTTSYRLTGLTEDTSYTLRVEAYDEEGNISRGGPEVTFKTVLGTDTTPPNWFEPKITATNYTNDGFTLNWEGAKDRGGVTAYRIFIDDNEIITLPATADSFDIRGIDPNAPLHIKVEAGDAAGNWSTTGPSLMPFVPDTTAPNWSTDRSLEYSNITDSSVLLDWTPAVDNRAVEQYGIFQGGDLLNTIPGDVLSFTVSGLAKSSSYTFKVEAGDAAGNWTSDGPVVTLKTLAGAVVHPAINLYPTDDKYYHQGDAESEINMVDQLKVKHDVDISTTNRRAYLKFDIGSVTDSVYKATLHLYNFDVEWNDNGVNAAADLFSASDNWTESGTLLWADKPEMLNKLDSIPITIAGGSTEPLGWLSFNVTDYIDSERRGDHIASFGIDDSTGNNRYFSFYSKDTPTNQDKIPYLSVETQTVETDAEAPAWTEGTLIASDIRPESVSLSWEGASDNVGINGYRVLKDGAIIATVAADVNEYVVSGLAPEQSYVFKVEAGDVANWSSDGPSVAASTAEQDTSAPKWPQEASLQIGEVTRNGILLDWTPASDNWGVTEYRLYNDDTLLGTVSGDVHSYAVTNLVPGTEYHFKLEALDQVGNVSSTALGAVGNTLLSDANAPEWSSEAGITEQDVSNSGLQLSWPAASDDEGVTGYEIYRNDAKIMTVASYITRYYVYGLAGDTAYHFEVRAIDASGNKSDPLTRTVRTKMSRDTIVPQWPTGSSIAESAGSDQVVLTWNEAADNDSVAQYKLYSSGIEITTVPGNVHTYTVTGLAAQTTYTFKVEAGDIAGNWSINGPSAAVTTLTPQDNGAGGDDPTGNDPTGDDSTGDDPTGDDPTGNDPTGNDPTGDDPTGNDPTDNSHSAQPNTGSLNLTVKAGELSLIAHPDANGKVAVVIDSRDILKSGSKQGVFRLQVTPAEGTKEVKVDIPVKDLLKAGSVKQLVLNVGLAELIIDAEYFNSRGADLTVNLQLQIAKIDPSSLSASASIVIGNHPVYDVGLTVNGEKVADIGGNVTVGFPYELQQGEDPNRIVVYYIDGSGQMQVVKNGKWNSERGMIEFKPEHFSLYATAYASVNFNDLNSVVWAKDSIVRLASRGIVEGVSEQAFNPNAHVTRAEFVKMLLQAFDLTDSGATSSLTDVEKDTWYYSYIATAQKLGIVQGKTDGTFGVNDEITREDMSVLIYRVSGLLDVKLGGTLSGDAFADQSEISPYAVKAVESMKASGIVNGVDGGRFAPLEAANRAQAAVIIDRLFNYVHNSSESN